MKTVTDIFANEKLLKADLARTRLHGYGLYGDRSVARVRAKHLRAWESAIGFRQKQSPDWPARRQRFVRDLDAKLCRLWNQAEVSRQRDDCWCFNLKSVW